MPRHPDTTPAASEISDRVFGALVAKARARGERVYPLHVGDTYLDPPAIARAPLPDDVTRPFNYAPVQGEPALLAAVVADLEHRGAARGVGERTQIMPGATAGLTIVCATVLAPGDEVLLPAPFWPLIRGIIRLRGATPIEVPFFDRLNDGSFDPERALESVVTERTTAVYVNTPNNPSGVALPEEVLAAIARVAARHDLWIIGDEAYELLDYRTSAPSPPWARADMAGRTISSHTLSKSYGLAGARIGFTHGPEAVMARVRGVQTFTTYCAPRPMQVVAARVLEQGAPWLARTRDAYARAAHAAASALGVPSPQGGTFLFFDAQRFLRPHETLFELLERCLEHGVLLTPGTACGKDYTSWARLCFTAVAPDELDEALTRLRAALAL
jgi:N-succinyldiaminopimelate aminotransferase